MQRRQQHTSRQISLLAVLPRRDLASTITTDDMRGQLNRLARDGRRHDCVALMQELDDWQHEDCSGIATAQYIPYLGVFENSFKS